MDNDQFYTSAPFQAFFENGASSLVLKANAPHFTILAVSNYYLALTHTQRKVILGKNFFEVFAGGNPQLPFAQDSLYQSFEQVIAKKQPHELPIVKHSIPEAEEVNSLHINYCKSVNVPVVDEQGNVAYIVNTTTSTDWEKLSREELEEAKLLWAQLVKEQTISPEITHTNQHLLPLQMRLHHLEKKLEEKKHTQKNDQVESEKNRQVNEDLRAANQVQTTINQELQQAQTALLRANQHLQVSETRLESILSQVPIPVLVLSGPYQTVTTANDAILRFWRKQQSEVMGKPMLQIFPELTNQVFPKLWQQVYNTGKVVKGQDQPVKYHTAEGTRINYIDYHYQPVKNLDGKVTGVLVTLIDNTDKVAARHLLEESEERLRLIIDTAKLGTWYISAATRQLITSPRLKELFGFYPTDEMPYEAAIAQITDEYRANVVAAVEAAITKGEAYDQEYPVTGYHDKKVRWVRATGKLYNAGDSTAKHFSGTMADITERIQDEQRKNDFINMVSHELKTPLTSMSGYIQILKAKANKTDDSFAIGVMNKAYHQVKKMTTMINGFLNMNRLESGKIHLDIVQFNVEELLKEIVEESHLLFPLHTIKISCCDSLFLQADKDKIGQVITNFISNAVKYAYHSKAISVDCQQTYGQLTIGVTDYGKGIQPEDQEKIFERYYRINSSNLSTIAGFGIGLYLCAEIISRHHGQIGVNSQPGKGSTFWFSLPTGV